MSDSAVVSVAATSAAPATPAPTSAPAPQLARAVLAPNPVEIPTSTPSVFLAGSIDMGAAIDWQSALSASLSALPITILNPRRPDWDNTWTQDLSCEPFVEQVTWELDALEGCDVIAMFLSGESLAPISLLELGLWVRSGRLVVACEKNYWRRGNVQVVCKRWGVEVVDTLDELEGAVRRRFKALGVESA